MPLLQCIDLCKIYQNGKIYTQVLYDVCFSLLPSEMVAVIGSSGAGKSTLLHLLCGLDKPSSGDVIFEGESLCNISSVSMAEFRNRKFGFIFQSYHLLPDFNALENVAMPLLIGKIPKAEAIERAYEMLKIVGLKKRINHRPSELSGGESQRVAIARALINDPVLVMADEPTGNLDVYNSDSILNLLKEFNQTKGTAFLMVTHDIYIAKKMPRRVFMRDGYLKE